MKGMLGRGLSVAKGMFADVRGALDEVEDEADAEVEALLQKISGALMPEYRREAMAQLKEVLADNPKAQLAFGSMGMPILLQVLQEDRDDAELMRGALECLIHAMRGAGHGPAPPGPHAPPAMEQQAGSINAELFARRPEHTLALLALLEEEPVGVADFYVRYHVVQLLTVLLQACAYKLQDAIMSSRGVVRLMDMLGEREVIRNEALLLLVALAHRNEELQKIAAFEGAFDRVFQIVAEEGGPEGGVVVQDCLELLNNLLRANQANQRLFREMGHISRLVDVFTCPAATSPCREASLAAEQGSPAGVTTVSQQKAAILLCALETVMLLVAPQPAPAPDQQPQPPDPHSQAALLKHGALEALLPLCLTHGGLAPPAIATQALTALGDMVQGCASCQERLGSCTVVLAVGAQPVPVLQAVLRTALHSPEAPRRAAAEHVVRAYCHANPQGQVLLASTIAPVGVGGGGGQWGGGGGGGGGPAGLTFGQELAAALGLGGAGGARLEASGRAASVLQHLLVGNASAKARLLATPIELPASPTAAPEFLLPRCFRHLSVALQSSEPAGPVAAALVLRLLVVWMHGHAPSISAMLGGAMHLPLVVDALAGRLGGGGARVQGLAAVLLGVCLVHGSPAQEQQQPPPHANGAPSASPPAPSDVVLDVLLSRVGLSQLLVKLDALKRDPAFVAACTGPLLPQRITRATAAAATAGGDAAGPAAAPVGALAAPSGIFDHAFTLLVHNVEAEVKRHVAAAFARPRPDSGTAQAAAAGPSAAQLIASLPVGGDADAVRAAAAAALQELARAGDALRARNSALAEDVVRATGLMQAAQAAAAQQQGQQGQQGQQLGQHGRQQGPDAGASPGTATAAAQHEEVARLQQQVELLTARLSQAEADAAAAQEGSASAFSDAARLDADLKDVSAAYRTLEAHCQQLQGQCRDMQALLASAQQQLAQQQQQGQQQGPGPERGSSVAAGGVAEAEVQQRVEAAVAAARDAADAAAEEQLTDLLVCLGQEEQKVAVLSEKLASLGVDVEALVACISIDDVQ